LLKSYSSSPRFYDSIAENYCHNNKNFSEVMNYFLGEDTIIVVQKIEIFTTPERLHVKNTNYYYV